MTATRSQSWSASSRYWVVRSTVEPGGDESADRGPHLRSGARVEPGRRLIEEDQRRLGDEARREVEAAAHAAGVLGDGLLRGIRQPELLEELGGLAPGRRPAQALQAREQHEVLGARQHLVERGELPREADELANDLRLAHDVVTEDASSAGVGSQRASRASRSWSSCRRRSDRARRTRSRWRPGGRRRRRHGCRRTT